MAQIGVNVSLEHGSTITVSPMVCDRCLAFESKVFLKANYPDAEPHVYCNDTVYFHGEPEAIRSLLEQLLQSLEARTHKEVAA